MAGKRLEYDISVDASKGVQGLRQFSKAATKELQDVSGALEDTSTNGERVAQVLSQLAGEMKTQLSGATTAAEALSKALGPELTARADVGQIVGDLNKMGLTFDEITADADKLAGSLKQIDAVQMSALDSGLKTSSGNVDKLGKSASSSKSVLANLIGNSVQDLGALGGIAGSAGVAIGQMGEYMADATGDGEGLSSVLKNFGSLAAPMIGVAVATQLLSSAMESAAASRAFDAANVKQYFDALAEGQTAVESFNEEIRQTGELQFRAGMGGGPLGMFSTTKDLLPILDKANIKVDQFNKIVQDYVTSADFSSEANGRLDQSLRDLGLSWGDALAISKAARQEAHARIDANEKDARVTDLAGKSEAQLAEEHRQTAAAADAYTAATAAKADADERATTALQEHATAMQDEAAALTAQVDAMTASADSSIAAADASLKFSDAVGKSKKVQDDAKATQQEKTAAVNDERDALIGSAKAAQRYAQDQDAAAGKTSSAKSKVDAFNASLTSQAAYATPAAQRAVYEYLIQVNKIPPEKATEILALVDQGKLSEANTQLTTASRARTAAITADADTASANNELDRVADKKRVAYINTFILPPGTVNDAGGTIGVGGGIVAERRPEIVNGRYLVTSPTVMPPGTRVTSGVRTARILRHRGTSGLKSYDKGGVVAFPAPTSIVIQAGVIGNRFDVQRAVTKALRGHQRLNGKRP